MTKYAAGYSVAGVNAANTVLANLKAAAGDRILLLQINIQIETAPANPPIFSLERMNAVGTGGITLAPNGPFDPSDGAATGTLEVAWVTTRPTRLATPVNLIRSMLPITLGSQLIFDFSNRPIVIPLSGGLLLTNLNASGATLGQFGGNFVWDE